MFDTCLVRFSTLILEFTQLTWHVCNVCSGEIRLETLETLETQLEVKRDERTKA